MVTIVNYGLGNIQAFANIYKRLNIAFRIAHTAEELKGAEKIILPGVGSFDWAMRLLEESGLRTVLDDLVINQKRPLLGVCVGMQIMAHRSDEGVLNGLGWIDAEVRHFNTNQLPPRTQLPHMGWNDVDPTDKSSLFKDMDAPRFYFLHSYYIIPKKSEDVLSTTDYGISFTSAVSSGNIFGVQFHPEKSNEWGIKLLSNFAKM